MKKSYKKDTILKLLSSMSSEKEIRKYLDRFSSDDYRFAVIKVGGAVIQSDLENLVSSLAFLNEVGLRPIIVHGGGPKLSEELNKRKIEFSFLSGQRVTTKDVLDVAYEIFNGENKKIVSLEGVLLRLAMDQKIPRNEFIKFYIGNEINPNLKKFLDTSDKNIKPIFVNNYEWLKGLNYISFLRDIGKHFTINKMLTFESVKTRLDREQSLSYMEFNYMILQAYDFLELNKKENCTLQIGGSDQWGNITSGIELIRKKQNKESFALTCPLLTKSDGSKFGKSEDGNVWLDPDRTSPYKFFQYWLN